MTSSSRRNRSEIVRHRRKEEATKRLQDSAVLARQVIAPITTRNTLTPAVPTRNRSAVRRRETALSMPGIEVHMPTISFSGSAAKWRFVSFGLALALGAALYVASTSLFFRAAAPQVSGNARIPTDEIAAVLSSTNLQIFQLVPRDLEQRLRMNFPDLLEAHVAMWLPNVVTVEVHERTPVILWSQAAGYTWIDATGVAFRPRGTADGLITVQAQNAPTAVSVRQTDPLSPTPFIPPDLVQAVLALAPHAPAGAGLIFDAQHGLGWIDGRGWKVFFGTAARDVALKIRVYEAVTRMIDSKGLNPAFISVEYPEAPYYRMTQ